ncbi:MAG: hypothetical protein R2681_14770 [Pyrinomonadaceae bacterium]
MINVKEGGRCKHAGCDCTEIGADDYCNADCRIADENGKHGPCTCGHLECRVSESANKD